MKQQNLLHSPRSKFYCQRIVSHLSMSTVLSTAALLGTENSKSGYLEKKSNSIYNTIFPCTSQEYLKRFLILSGAYLYRFTDADNNKPKGVPIPIESIIVEKVDDFSFTLKSIRKSYSFRCYSKEDCNSWITAINDRKFMSIKEGMGHAQISENVARSNKAAKQLFEEALIREGANSSMNPLLHVN